MKLIAQNKKAFFDYEILEELEAGLVLLGTEIKAIRAGRVNITGSYVKPMTAEGKIGLYLIGGQFNVADGDETRTKKLLLHKSEIDKLTGKLSAGEFTIMPLSLYLSRGRAKIKIGLAKRRKKHDKRSLLKERDQDREIRRKLLNNQ